MYMRYDENQRDRLDGRRVARSHGIDQEDPDPLEAEEVLDDGHDPGRHPGRREGEGLDRRHQRVRQYVRADDISAGSPLRRAICTYSESRAWTTPTRTIRAVNGIQPRTSVAIGRTRARGERSSATAGSSCQTKEKGRSGQCRRRTTAARRGSSIETWSPRSREGGRLRKAEPFRRLARAERCSQGRSARMIAVRSQPQPDQVGDGLPVGDRDSEVEPYGTGDPVPVAHDDGPVEAVLLSEAGLLAARMSGRVPARGTPLPRPRAGNRTVRRSGRRRREE